MTNVPLSIIRPSRPHVDRPPTTMYVYISNDVGLRTYDFLRIPHKRTAVCHLLCSIFTNRRVRQNRVGGSQGCRGGENKDNIGIRQQTSNRRRSAIEALVWKKHSIGGVFVYRGSQRGNSKEGLTWKSCIVWRASFDWRKHFCMLEAFRLEAVSRLRGFLLVDVSSEGVVLWTSFVIGGDVSSNKGVCLKVRLFVRRDVR